MLRIAGIVCAAVALFLLTSAGSAQGTAKKNQMVKGTIKVVETDKDVLIVSQKVKNEAVDRELSILNTTEFEVTKNGKTETGVGREGLRLLEGHEGAQVNVKCDKDVNVLSVKVKAK